MSFILKYQLEVHCFNFMSPMKICCSWVKIANESKRRLCFEISKRSLLLKKKKKSNLCLFIWYVSALGVSISNYKDFLQECIVLFGILTSSLLESTPKYFQIKCRAIVLNTWRQVVECPIASWKKSMVKRMTLRRHTAIN